MAPMKSFSVCTRTVVRAEMFNTASISARDVHSSSASFQTGECWICHSLRPLLSRSTLRTRLYGRACLDLCAGLSHHDETAGVALHPPVARLFTPCDFVISFFLKKNATPIFGPDLNLT
jgi:hypothetical protein